jgi:hypothetical protein
VVLDELVFVPGGYTSAGQVTDVLEVYDPRSDSWTRETPLPQPLCSYAIAAAAGQMYLFGGWNGREYVPSVYIYDPATQSWASGTPLARPRGFAAASTLDDLIYVAGGYDGVVEYALLEVFDPAMEAQGQQPWSSRSAMAVPRAGLGMASAGEALYAIGGGWTAAADFNERYDPSSDTWSSIPTPLSLQWRNLGAASLQGRIFAMGGWSGGHLALNQEYRTLLYTIHLPLGAKGNGN